MAENKKTIKNNYKPETDVVDEATLDQNTELADKLSSAMGYDDAADFIDQTKRGLSSNDAVVKQFAQERAATWYSKLLLLCLKQEIYNQENFDYVDTFAEMFNDGVLDEGNSKSYTAMLPTGNSTHNRNQFIPEGVSVKVSEQFVISMYDATTKELTDQAYQFRKIVTLEPQEYMPYFTSGALNQVLAGIRESVGQVFSMYKFNKLATLVTSATPQKTVEGTALDMYQAWSDEIFPLIRDMTFANTEYNYSATSKKIQASPLDDLIIVMSAANLQRLSSGIKSQLFNVEFFENDIARCQKVCLGKKLVIGDEKTPVEVSSVPYIDDETILVFDRKGIKHIEQINKTGTQEWVTNMTIEVVLHVWGAADILPWCSMFKYHNKNLPKLPGAPTLPPATSEVNEPSTYTLKSKSKSKSKKEPATAE